MTLRLNTRRFRELRRERGLFIPAVAKLCGVSEVTVRTWSSGRYNPNEENLVKLAAVMGVPLDDIAMAACPTCGQTLPEP